MYGVAPLASSWRLATERRRDDNVDPWVCVLPTPSDPRECNRPFPFCSRGVRYVITLFPFAWA